MEIGGGGGGGGAGGGASTVVKGGVGQPVMRVIKEDSFDAGVNGQRRR